MPDPTDRPLPAVEIEGSECLPFLVPRAGLMLVNCRQPMTLPDLCAVVRALDTESKLRVRGALGDEGDPNLIGVVAQLLDDANRFKSELAAERAKVERLGRELAAEREARREAEATLAESRASVARLGAALILERADMAETNHEPPAPPWANGEAQCQGERESYRCLLVSGHAGECVFFYPDQRLGMYEGEDSMTGEVRYAVHPRLPAPAEVAGERPGDEELWRAAGEQYTLHQGSTLNAYRAVADYVLRWARENPSRLRKDGDARADVSSGPEHENGRTGGHGVDPPAPDAEGEEARAGAMYEAMGGRTLALDAEMLDKLLRAYRFARAPLVAEIAELRERLAAWAGIVEAVGMVSGRDDAATMSIAVERWDAMPVRFRPVQPDALPAAVREELGRDG